VTHEANSWAKGSLLDLLSGLRVVKTDADWPRALIERFRRLIEQFRRLVERFRHLIERFRRLYRRFFENTVSM
jgi:hypothetical protein